MVGRLTLNQKIGVRIPVPQPASAQYRGRPKSEVLRQISLTGPGRPRPVPSLEIELLKYKYEKS